MIGVLGATLSLVAVLKSYLEKKLPYLQAAIKLEYDASRDFLGSETEKDCKKGLDHIKAAISCFRFVIILPFGILAIWVLTVSFTLSMSDRYEGLFVCPQDSIIYQQDPNQQDPNQQAHNPAKHNKKPTLLEEFLFSQTTMFIVTIINALVFVFVFVILIVAKFQSQKITKYCRIACDTYYTRIDPPPDETTKDEF